MKKVVIFGIGAGADIALRYLKSDSDFLIAGFTAEKKFLTSQEHHGLRVVDFEMLEASFPPGEYCLFAPLGYQDLNRVRERVFTSGKEKGYSFISYVHSSVKFTDGCDIGENCFILENQSINLDVKIGNNVTLWSHNHIGDRTRIEDHVWITSGCALGGDVVVGAHSFLGMNATISNKVVLGKRNFIGANALISASTEDQSVYVVPGTPKAPMNSERFIKIANI